LASVNINQDGEEELLCGTQVSFAPLTFYHTKYSFAFPL
jgi:hypothetical protein